MTPRERYGELYDETMKENEKEWKKNYWSSWSPMREFLMCNFLYSTLRVSVHWLQSGYFFHINWITFRPYDMVLCFNFPVVRTHKTVIMICDWSRSSRGQICSSRRLPPMLQDRAYRYFLTENDDFLFYRRLTRVKQKILIFIFMQLLFNYGLCNW